MVDTKIEVSLKKKTNLFSGKFSTLFQDKMYIFTTASIFLKMLFFSLLIGFYSMPSFLTYLSSAALILSFSFLFKGRRHLWALIVIDVLITVLMIGDAWYYRGYGGFLNMFLLSETTNLDHLGSSVLSMFRPVDIVYVIDDIFLIVFALYNRELYKGVKRSISLFLITLLVPVIYLSYAHYKVDILQRSYSGQMLFRQSWAPVQTMSDLGTIDYHILDTYEYYQNTKRIVLSDKDKSDINAWFDKNIENLPDNQYAGMFKGKNLLVIQVESLENFVIGQKIQGQEITPNINKLLKNSYYFDNYHENVWNGTSSDADLMTNTGVYPVRDGSTFFRFPDNKYENSLPNLMAQMNYTTFAIHPDKGAYWNWMPALKSIGFQNCFDASHFISKNPIGLGLSDQEFLAQAAPIIESEKQPFYTFMVTLTSHAPFDLPQKYRELKLTGGFDSNILGDYFQSIHYTDKYIGEFLDELKSKGLLDNTVVVLYGDHTSVHKFYPDEVAAVKPQQEWWMNNDMRIPLIIYNPSVKGKVFDVQAGQIDLMPTILYLMGEDKSKYQRDTLGKVLFNTNKNYTILENFEMYGNYTPEEEAHAKDGIILSNKMVESDYFKGK